MLRKAVDKVGNSAAAVRKQVGILGGRREAWQTPDAQSLRNSWVARTTPSGLERTRFQCGAGMPCELNGADGCTSRICKVFVKEASQINPGWSSNDRSEWLGGRDFPFAEA